MQAAYLFWEITFFMAQACQDFYNRQSKNNSGATIFSYAVSDPERYGVVEFDDTKRISRLVEKPSKPPSNQAVQVCTSWMVRPQLKQNLSKNLQEVS